MKRSIYRRISSIEFDQTTARLNVRRSAFVGFWVIQSLAVISFGIGIYLWIDTEKPVFFLLFGGFAVFSEIYAFGMTVYESFEFNRLDPFLRMITTTFQTRNDPGEREVKQYLYGGLTIVWEIRRFFNSTSIHIYEDQFLFKLTLPNREYAALINWINDSSAPVETTSKTSLVDLYRKKDTMGYAIMQQELRSSGSILLILGAIFLLAFWEIGPSVGIVLLVVGVFSFWINEAPILIMNAVAATWVIIMFLFWSDAYFLYIYAVGYFFVHVIGSIQEYQSYRLYERTYLSSLEDESAGKKNGRAARTFPGLGIALAGLGFIGYMVLWIFVFKDTGMAFQESWLTGIRADWTSWDLVGSIALAAGVVGFGMSVASVASDFKTKWLCWLGAVLGGALVVFEIGTRLWFILSG